jgi:hypothetical protein
MRSASTAILAAAALCLVCQGCFLVAAAAVGVAAFGVISYDRNEATTDFHAALPAVWNATLHAMKELGYAVDLGQQPGASEGTISTGDATVKVERHPQDFTRVRVRIGTFDTDDNRRRAQLILEAVQKKVS